MFLKRMVYPGINKKELFIGSIVTVYSRQLKLIDYGDTFTRKEFAQGKETTFALIKPDVYVHTGKIIDSIYRNGFIISRLAMGRFSANQAARFAAMQPANPGAEAIQFLQSDVCTGIELIGQGSMEKWNALIGPEDSIQAKMHASSSLRAAYGTSAVKNAVHGSSSNQ